MSEWRDYRKGEDVTSIRWVRGLLITIDRFGQCTEGTMWKLRCDRPWIAKIRKGGTVEDAKAELEFLLQEELEKCVSELGGEA